MQEKLPASYGLISILVNRPHLVQAGPKVSPLVRCGPSGVRQASSAGPLHSGTGCQVQCKLAGSSLHTAVVGRVLGVSVCRSFGFVHAHNVLRGRTWAPQEGDSDSGPALRHECPAAMPVASKQYRQYCMFIPW